MIYLYLLFCIYAIVEGVIEAILYGKKGAETFSWNEHIVYVFARIMVLFSILFASRLTHLSNLDCLIYASVCMLSFPFFHDGSYYETARKINRPEYRFWSNSQTSTAKIEITWFVRVNMLLVSIISLLVYYFII